MNRHHALAIVRSVGRGLVPDPGRITEEMRFVGDLGFDSMTVVELVLALEDELSMSISADELAMLETVQDAVDIVLRRARNAA